MAAPPVLDVTCSEPDCDKPVRSLGLCRKHYRQNRLARKRGDAPAVARPKRDLSGPKRGDVVSHTETEEGVPIRVYHRAGTITLDGVKREHERYVWTHPHRDRETCEACKLGLIPANILDGSYKEVS